MDGDSCFLTPNLFENYRLLRRSEVERPIQKHSLCIKRVDTIHPTRQRERQRISVP
jgi:hypothetical protein